MLRAGTRFYIRAYGRGADLTIALVGVGATLALTL